MTMYDGRMGQGRRVECTAPLHSPGWVVQYAETILQGNIPRIRAQGFKENAERMMAVQGPGDWLREAEAFGKVLSLVDTIQGVRDDPTSVPHPAFRKCFCGKVSGLWWYWPPSYPGTPALACAYAPGEPGKRDPEHDVITVYLDGLQPGDLIRLEYMPGACHGVRE